MNSLKFFFALSLTVVCQWAIAQSSSLYAAKATRASGKISGECLSSLPISKSNKVLLIINLKDTQNNLVKADTATYIGGVFVKRNNGWSTLYASGNGAVRFAFERTFPDAVLSSAAKVEFLVYVDSTSSNKVEVNLN